MRIYKVKGLYNTTGGLTGAEINDRNTQETSNMVYIASAQIKLYRNTKRFYFRYNSAAMEVMLLAVGGNKVFICCTLELTHCINFPLQLSLVKTHQLTSAFSKL